VACPVVENIDKGEGNGGIAPFGVEVEPDLANRWKQDFKRYLATTREIETRGLLQQGKGSEAKHFLTAGLPAQQRITA
jgi:hypothetical protein